MVEKFDVSADGFIVDGRVMDNGERRIRIKAPDGTAYLRTEMDAGQKGEWQNAHHHCGVFETYIVQKGWIGYAERVRKGDYRLSVYSKGASFTTRVGLDHNVYMPAGAVIHTVQHGVPIGNPFKKGNDWYPGDPAFDEWTKSLSEALIANFSKSDFVTE